MPQKLLIHNERMLALIAWAVHKELEPSERAFLIRIGFAPTNISNARRGLQGFNTEHIANICKVTGANANWILGLEGNMFRKPGKTPIDQLKEAVVAVEQELKTKGLRLAPGTSQQKANRTKV